MIVTRLVGGLGNQMFQYSVGRALARRHGQELWMDIHDVSRDPDRSYALGPFRIEERLAGWRQRWPFQSPFQRVRRRLRRLAGLDWQASTGWIQEAGFHYQELSLDPRRDYYLNGYWQSEKYFRDAADILRREFRLKDEAEGVNAEMLARIRDHLSVSLHVRRGDYVQKPATQAFHGSCSLEYYRAAADRIAGWAGGRPTFFAFSDDPDWVEANLKLSYPLVLVRHNPPQVAHEDLRLMSACQHHVTANSSFSWWGAWLGDHPAKRVVCPRRWFNEFSGNDDRDLAPEGWERI